LQFPGEKPGLGHKPCIIFEGAAFDATFEMRKLRNLLLDHFRGRVVDKINLAGVDRVCVVTAPGESAADIGFSAKRGGGAWFFFLKKKKKKKK
jgi:hypothetical protein